MIPKPLECLPHAPSFTELREYELDGFANPFIGMKNDLAHGVPDITDRKSLKQLSAACFRLLARLQSLPKDLKLDDAEGPFDAQDQLVVEIVQIVDLLLVGDQGSKNLAHLQQTTPVFVRARQSRGLSTADDAHFP